MLSDEIAAARFTLGLALQQSDPAVLRHIAEGVCARLDVLEAEAVEWQASAEIAPLARLPDGALPANVALLRSGRR